MELIAKGARFGSKLMSLIVGLLVVVMLAYGGYSLWDNYMITSGALLSSELLQYKPNGEMNEEGYSPTLQELALINEDVRGWITIEDTQIDYPVVQAEQDMFYVNRDVYKEFSLSGSIFLTSINSPDFSDCYNIIYGHHMDSGAMFGNVVDFREKEYFDARDEGTLFLLNKNYDIKLFACIATDAYDKHIYKMPDKNNKDLVKYLKKHADQYREIGVTGESKIVALSTCTEASTNGRVVLFGELVERGG